MKALIFGANGQDGYYLNELCKLKGIEPIGVSRSGDWIHGDVARYDQVAQLITQHQPAYVFHVAANSSTHHETMFENHATISGGTLNILEAVKKYNPSSKVFITGSGIQFKNAGNPISENDEFVGNSPYSVVRIQSVYAARYYRSLGLHVYVGYLFHHESPVRKLHHVSQVIVRAAQRIANGSSEVVTLGDISVEKEWSFAGDIVKGIFTLIEQDSIYESVIGSGTVYSIEKWLELCFCSIGEDWRNHVILLKGFTPEYKRLVSDPKTLNSLGWFPTVELPELAAMMMKNEL